MLVYTLHFEWPEAGTPSEAQTFDAETNDRAKVKAAILYAGASFDTRPPTGYRLLGPSGELVYHYPEG